MKTYTEEFKREAIAALNSGMSKAELYKKFKVGNSSIYQWRKKLAPAVSRRTKFDENGFGPSTKFPVEVKLAAVKRMQGGDSAQTIGDELKTSPGSIRTWRKQYEKAQKKAAKKTNGHSNGAATKSGYDADAKAAAVARLNAGESAKALAEELGVSDASIYLWRKAIQNGGVSPYSRKAKANGHGNGAAATMEAPARKAHYGNNSHLRDAVTYLKHAEAKLMSMVRDGSIKRPDSVHLLMLLALEEIQKA